MASNITVNGFRKKTKGLIFVKNKSQKDAYAQFFMSSCMIFKEKCVSLHTITRLVSNKQTINEISWSTCTR